MTATLRISRSHGAVAVGALAVVAIVILDALVRDEPTPRGDDLIYERMAQDPFATHTFPAVHRVDDLRARLGADHPARRPVFYAASAFVLRDKRGLSVATLGAFAVLIVGYAGSMQHSGVRTGIIETGPPPYPVR